LLINVTTKVVYMFKECR